MDTSAQTPPPFSYPTGVEEPKKRRVRKKKTETPDTAPFPIDVLEQMENLQVTVPEKPKREFKTRKARSHREKVKHRLAIAEGLAKAREKKDEAFHEPGTGKFKKGNPGHLKGSIHEKTRQFFKDLIGVYAELGGKTFLLQHIQGNPGNYEKLLDRIMKIASTMEEKDKTLEIKGGMIHEHRYGFSPEMVAAVMGQIIQGQVSEDHLLAEPIPDTPEEDRIMIPEKAPVVDATFTEVNGKTLNEGEIL